MSFLNAMLLGGSALSLAPLIIHLFNRSRSKPVDWGAMHFLEVAIHTSSRRIQWEALLLLLVRMSIPVILALCMARPVLTSVRSGGARGARSIVMLIDNSLSMQATTAEPSGGSWGESPDDTPAPPGRSLLQVAKSLLSEVVGAFPDEQVGLLTTHAIARWTAAANFDPQATELAIERVECSGESSDIVSRLEAAIRSSLTLPSPSRHVIFSSDFQQSTWQAVTESELSGLRELLNAEALPVQLTFMPVRSARSTPPNLAIHLPTRGTASAFVSEVYDIQPTVWNFNETEMPVRVTLSVDGQALESRSLNVDPGTSQQLGFACTFTQPGWHFLSVEISDGWGLSSDDRAFEVVQVLESVHLVILDGTSQLADSDTDSSEYLRLALAPFQAGDGERNHFQVASIEPSQLSAAQTADADAVILADVPRLDDSQVELLRGFVAAGGGLIVLAGEQLDLPWYNQHFNVDTHLLPMAYASSQHAVVTKPAVIPPDALQQFEGLSQVGNGLDSVAFSRWLQLMQDAQPNTATQAALESTSDERVSLERLAPVRLLQFVDGEVLAVGHSYGAGFVVQAGLGLDPDWTNLPLRPAFVPLLQQLVLVCTTAKAVAHNVYCGEASHLGLQATDSLVPGVFEVQVTDRQETSQAPQLVSTAMYPAESDPHCLDASQLQDLATRCGAKLAQSPAELVALDREQRDGKEIWQQLLGLVLVLVFAELLIAARITRGVS